MLIIIAIIIATVVSIVRLAVNDNSNISTDVQVNSLLDSSAERSVSMTVRGNIVADENYRTYRIEISPNSRVLSKTEGYLGKTTVLETLPNNIPAYEQLVYALNKANYMKGVELTGDKNDLRGVCATGTLYSFEILNGEKPEKMLWTSTCSGAKGSLSASLSQVYNLFMVQIPDFNELTDGLWQ